MTPRPTVDFPHTLHSREDVYAFFRSWGYNVQPTDWPVDELPERARELIGEMVLVAHQEGTSFPLQVFLVELKPQPHEQRFRKTYLSPILEPFYRMFPQGEYLFVFARADYSAVSFVSPKRVGEERQAKRPQTMSMFPVREQDAGQKGAATKLRMRILSPEFPHLTYTERQILENIRLTPAESRAELAWEKVREAFSVEKVTEAFYREYRTLFEALKDALVAHIPDLERRHAFVQRLLSRLLFLCFLQKKRWLNQNPRYLFDLFDHAEAQGKNFYEEYLHALFFTALNQPDYLETMDGRLGIIPFLNGGLFEMVDSTDEPGKVRLENALFRQILGDDGLLRRYNFTIIESTPYTQEIAVDPEMLGKVFESVVLQSESAVDYSAPDLRKATGSYYTPRIVVHFIVREVLERTLAERVPGENLAARLGNLLEIDASDGLNDDELARLKTLISQEEAQSIRSQLDDLKACDPSVGSGAFAVGLLQELVNLSILCETRLGGKDPREVEGKNYLAETKRRLIERSVYGVDIQQQAVEICKLRLWLSLAVDIELKVDALTATRDSYRRAIHAIQPLPNLSYKIRRGDALLDQIQGYDFVLEKVQAGPQVTALQDEIRRAQERYFDVNAPSEKHALRLKVLTARLNLSERYLDIMRKKVGTVEVPLFGGETAKEAEARRLREAQLEKLDAALARVRQMQADLAAIPAELSNAGDDELVENFESGDESAMTFAWRLDFPEVFGRKGREGFDIVVGNPPFVTARSAEKRKMYQERWKQVAVKNFQLVSPFFVRGFGILAVNGQLGFIVSNAFAKREFGQPLVEEFFPTVELQKVVDCSGLMFPGHGTPTCIVFGKQPEASPLKFVKDQDALEGAVRVTATLPGGGDLRTPPEDSPLWSEITEFHDIPSYVSARISVNDITRTDMAKWPWNLTSGDEPTKGLIETGERFALRDLTGESIGHTSITRTDDVFILPDHLARRSRIELSTLKFFGMGETIRDWSMSNLPLIVFPYNADFSPITPEERPNCINYLFPYKDTLENVVMHGSVKKKETKTKWFEYSRLARAKLKTQLSIALPELATHQHAFVFKGLPLFHQKVPVIKLDARFSEEQHHILAAIINSSTVLYWLKLVCFSRRESSEPDADTYYEFAGGKLEELPIPKIISENNNFGKKLLALSRACWERGQILPSLASQKLFERAGEAYAEWNSALAGYVQPHELLAGGFETAEELESLKGAAQSERERLRGEMIALQEEMDWVVYAAYGLLNAEVGMQNAEYLEAFIQQSAFSIPPLALGERPFELLKNNQPIPDHFSTERKALWQARMEVIGANEHIRRMEQPVYKRRWYRKESDEQEFRRAFEWFLLEKAEFHLEYGAQGGPIALEAWASALWADARIRAAASVIGGADGMSLAFFTKLFKSIVDEVTVPEGIPSAEAWEALEKKMAIPAKVKKIRGKLNVPRERFWVRGKSLYGWSGKK